MPAPQQKMSVWEFFQSLGKTFMLPVALLSFCGIMLGIGSSLSSHDVLTLLPMLDQPWLQYLFLWMAKLGSFAFSYLPVMFAVAIPLGMARENKGVAAFAGFVGYAVLNLSINFWLNINGILPTTDAAVLKANNVQSILGIPSIDTGILGAVIVGIVVFWLHERFHNIRLPDALAFFGGTRFVPIITTLVIGVLGLVVPLIWPFFARGISPAILAALGGVENITSLDNCLTRLRLTIADMSKVNDAALKANGAIGVVHLNKSSLQVVIGPQVQSVKDELSTLMNVTA